MKFTIQGRLDGLNAVIEANRRNKYEGNNLKQKNQSIVYYSIPYQICNQDLKYPVDVYITYYEPNNKRDADNVISSQKFILDAMVQRSVLPNDSRKYVDQIHPLVYTDRKNPRIEVEIKEKQK